MKKIYAILAAMLLTISAFAQEGRAIYNKYSEQAGVEAVYISPVMFRLMGNLPDIKVTDDKINISPIIKSLSGFYLLNVSQKAAPNLTADVKKAIQAGKYELMMEAKDGGDKVTLYTISKGDVITSFVLLSVEQDGDTTFICLDGTLSEKDLNALIGSAMKSAGK